MDIRNLNLFCPDDRMLFDVSEFINVINITPYGWERHCDDIFGRGDRELDLLSCDINFSLDASDPAYPGGDTTYWGLAHALAALGCRPSQDKFANRLPLAWEVRSVSPQVYEGFPDATRLYGLLRSIAANPREGESFGACLWREYTERYGRTPSISSEVWLDLGLQELMAADLNEQQSIDTDADSILERLLPEWRRQFVAAVSAGKVKVHEGRLQTEFARMMLGCKPENDGRVIWDAKHPPFLPVRDERGHFKYGINLFSIFADKVRRDDARGYYYLLPDREAGIGVSEFDECNVISWMEDIIVKRLKLKSTGRGMSLMNIGQRATVLIRENSLQSALPDPNAKGRVKEPEKCAYLFCFLCAHSYIVYGNQNFGRSNFDRIYHLYTHPLTWNRPLKKIFGHLNPLPLGAAIVKILKGDRPEELSSDDIDWIQQGLSGAFDKCKYPDIKEMAHKKAPGLFQRPSGSEST